MPSHQSLSEVALLIGPAGSYWSATSQIRGQTAGCPTTDQSTAQGSFVSNQEKAFPSGVDSSRCPGLRLVLAVVEQGPTWTTQPTVTVVDHQMTPQLVVLGISKTPTGCSLYTFTGPRFEPRNCQKYQAPQRPLGAWGSGRGLHCSSLQSSMGGVCVHKRKMQYYDNIINELERSKFRIKTNLIIHDVMEQCCCDQSGKSDQAR